MIEGLPCKALHCEGGGRVGKGRVRLIVGYWTQSQARASGGHSQREERGQSEANKWNKRHKRIFPSDCP